MRVEGPDLGDWSQLRCEDPAEARPLLGWCEGLTGCANQEELALRARLGRSSLVRFGAGKGGRGGRRTLEGVLGAAGLPLWVAVVTMLPTIRAVHALWLRGGPVDGAADPAARRQALALAARTSVVAFLAARAPAAEGTACVHAADARVLFAWFQTLTGRSLRDLAEVAGVSHETLRHYARGTWPVATPALPGLAEGMGGPAWLVEGVMLPAVRTVRLVAAHPLRDSLLAGWEGALGVAPAAARVDAVWFSAGELLAAAERGVGERLWRRLAVHGAAARVCLVKRHREFHSWELVERFCAESREAATDSAREALRLALLALRIARLTRGGGLFDLQLEGYALVHVANAWRAGGKPGRAAVVFSHGLAFWQAGGGAAPGRLPAWRLLDLEGSLLRDLRRFPEATERLDDALLAAPRAARGRILINKATVLDQKVEPEASIAVLEEAAPWIDGRREPHLAFLWACLMGVNLCHLGRFGDAQALLPRAQALAERLGKALNGLRLEWLRGRIEAGLGHLAEALAALTAVQRAFRERGMAFDYALVSLETGAVLLEQGRFDEVQSLAIEMEWIFEQEGIHQEAEKALGLFRKAAEGRTATAELAGRVVRFLYKAQHNPELAFAA